MKKIVLTKSQEEILRRQVAGELSPFFLSKEEREDLDVVLDKMDELEEELDPSDEEVDGFLDRWFLKKYEEQKGK